MNLALPAVVLFFLALPGLSFRYFYRRGHSSTPVIQASVVEETTYGLAVALAVHAVFVPLASVVPMVPQPDLPAVLALISGKYGPGDASYGRVVAAVAENFLWIASYFLVTSALSAYLGQKARRLIQDKHLDIRYPILRTNTSWADLLTARLESDVVVCCVSAVAELGGVAYLYVGFVDEFFYDRNGDLERLVLLRAHRRRFVEDRHDANKAPTLDADEYYAISGDRFVLRYSEVKTLNVDYYHAEVV